MKNAIDISCFAAYKIMNRIGKILTAIGNWLREFGELLLALAIFASFIIFLSAILSVIFQYSWLRMALWITGICFAFPVLIGLAIALSVVYERGREVAEERKIKKAIK